MRPESRVPHLATWAIAEARRLRLAAVDADSGSNPPAAPRLSTARPVPSRPHRPIRWHSPGRPRAWPFPSSGSSRAHEGASPHLPSGCRSMLVGRTSEAADRTPRPSRSVRPFRRERRERLRIGGDVFMRLLPRRARQSLTRFGRKGDVVQQPPLWVGLAGLLAFAGGPRGRRAAARGSACFALAAIVANLLVGRRLGVHPRGPTTRPGCDG